MSSRWKHLKADANQAIEYGNYGEAEILLRRAVGELSKFKEGDSNIPLTYESLASVLCHQKKYQEAEQLFVRSLKYRDDFLKFEVEALIECLNNLSKVLLILNDADGAEKLLKRILAIIEDKEESERLADCLFDLGKVNEQKNRVLDAEELYLRSLVIRQHLFSEEHLSVADSYFALAELYDESGRLNRSRATLRKLRQSKRTAFRCLTPRSSIRHGCFSKSI